MEKEFQWTEKLVAECFRYISANFKVTSTLSEIPALIESFKQSHRLKKDWEVVSFVGFDNKLLPFVNGKYRNDTNSISLQNCFELKFPIHSVRRLSDGEVFSVGDFIIPHQLEFPHPIRSFTIMGNTMCVNFTLDDKVAEWNTIDLLRKAPERKVLFTTTDGKHVSVGDQIYFVINGDWNICSWYFHESDALGLAQKLEERICFSTHEKAAEYVLMNKPVLSVNDVLDRYRFSLGMLTKESMRERVIEYAKQKLQTK